MGLGRPWWLLFGISEEDAVVEGEGEEEGGIEVREDCEEARLLSL